MRDGATLKSLAKNPNYVADNALLIYKSHNKLTLVLEGKSDRRFWLKFLNSEYCRVDDAGEKDAVIETAEIIRGRHKGGSGPLYAQCFVDLDYDHLIGIADVRDGTLIYIDLHFDHNCSRDLEIVLIRSRSFYSLLLQEDLESETERIRDRLSSEGKKIGALRLLERQEAQKSNYPFGSMKDLPWSIFFNPTTLDVDIRALAFSLCKSSGTDYLERNRLIARAEEILESGMDAWQLCRGHDLTFMLSEHLTAKGHRNFSVSEVERSLRLGFDKESFVQTTFGRAVIDWGESHERDLLNV